MNYQFLFFDTEFPFMFILRELMQMEFEKSLHNFEEKHL